MKKLNNKGFVLAETLIVTLFVLIIFSMIYTNYYPLIGLYEERETYDDVDGKYVAYWIKKLVESDSYYINPDSSKGNSMNTLGYIRFECSDVSEEDNRRSMCINLVKSLEISNCDEKGDSCDIFITHYRIGGSTIRKLTPDFKKTVNEEYYDFSGAQYNRSLRHYDEIDESGLCAFNNNKNSCRISAFRKCCTGHNIKDLCSDSSVDGSGNITLGSGRTPANDDERESVEYCKKYIDRKVFPSYVVDYINYLPDYTKPNTSTGAKYRIIVVVNHKKAHNNYYSFSTMEVVKNA